MKNIFIFFLLCCVIFAEVGLEKFDKDDNKIFELLADKVYQKDQKIHAEGNAVLLNNDIYIIAQKIIYDQAARKAEVEGDVKIYKGGNLYAQSKKMLLNVSENYMLIEPFYVQDTETGMWINAKFADSSNKKYYFKRAVISGCSIERPVWHMNVSSGSFDSEKSILSIWNPTLYLGSVPVFYFPYLRLSVKDERSTGFLYPQFASSSREGFIYMQPFYLALQKFWDMTFTPQVRTQRGVGGEVELRIADPSNNLFYFKTGYFYNKKSYVEEFNLRNKEVFGFEFFYSNENPLQKYFGVKHPFKNGLFLDFLYMNDLDYLRLEQFNARITDGTRVSKANVFAQTQDHYFGLNFRYFLNLNKINNDTTFQTLPNVQYHKYLDNLFFKDLLYSVDYGFRNTYRDVGYGYVENSLKIPVGMQFSLLKKYLSLGIWSDLYISNLGINNSSKSYINKDITTRGFGNFVSTNLHVILNTDLAKSYDKVFHVMQFEASLTIPYFKHSDGLLHEKFFTSNDYGQYYNKATGQYNINGNFYNDIWNPSTLGEYVTTLKRLDMKMMHYFYGIGGKELFYWRILQGLNFDDPVAFYRNPLENKIGFSPVDGLDLSAIFSYSFYYQNIQEISISATYNRKYLKSGITYYIKNQFIDITTLKQATTSANYLSFNFSNDFGYFGLNASASLNFNNWGKYRDYSTVVTNWSVGIFKNIRCFGFALKLASQRTPILTNDTNSGGYASSVLNNTYIKFEFSFVPLAQTGLTYRFYNK
ncbi:LPS-assembly protein LptD [Helicobacter anatolicus]|uniref:LPS-assembly protein LptD n=1 Tax=Helicobacter anatolicus TaxID=2905874 RepID=UPI001E4AEAAB|nr:LPS assembly protein LptD [Helicobacter anatolicus]